MNEVNLKNVAKPALIKNDNNTSVDENQNNKSADIIDKDKSFFSIFKAKKDVTPEQKLIIEAEEADKNKEI